MAKAVKLADIAEQLGVSTVTVSKALSGQKGVSEAMREKIKDLEVLYANFFATIKSVIISLSFPIRHSYLETGTKTDSVHVSIKGPFLTLTLLSA